MQCKIIIKISTLNFFYILVCVCVCGDMETCTDINRQGNFMMKSVCVERRVCMLG